MKYPEDVYFKKTVNYELEVGGRPITVCIEEDTHGGDVHYLHEDGNWSTAMPDWIRELGESEWGESIFESVVFIAWQLMKKFTHTKMTNYERAFKRVFSDTWISDDDRIINCGNSRSTV